MSSPDEFLTLREAAEHLGVHYMTVYRYVRLGQLRASKIGATWQVSVDDLAAFEDPPEEDAAPADTPWSERLRGRMLAADQAGAWRVIEAALASGFEPAEVYTGMVAPAMRDIGELWAADQITVGEEHMASAVANRLIGRLGPRFARRGRPRGVVLATTPPGERHNLGLEMLADILRGAGYDVMVLGSDVPLDSLAFAIKHSDRLVAVCISTFTPGSDEVITQTIDTVRRQATVDVPVLLGGAAVPSRDHATALGADGWAADGVSAVAEIERLTAQESPV